MILMGLSEDLQESIKANHGSQTMGHLLNSTFQAFIIQTLRTPMHSSLSDLPIEVLKNIFKFVDAESKQTVFQCQLVCRQWKFPAQQVAYSTLILSRPHQVPLLCNTFNGNHLMSLKPFVKTIHLMFQDSYHSNVYLTLLSDLFPFVEYFTSIDSDENTFQRLIGLKTSSNWRHLKQIPFILKDHLIEAYNQCAFSYRKSLTHLHLYHVTLEMENCLLDIPTTKANESVKQRNFKTFGKFSQNLHKFNNLEKLYVCYYGQDFFYKFNQEFAMSQSLNAVHLENYKKGASQSPPPVNLHVSKIIGRPNIKKLSGNFFINNNDTLEHIMRIFTNLDVLKVNNDGSVESRLATQGRISTINELYLAQFISFVKKIPCHHVTLQVKDMVLLAGFFNCISTRKPTSTLPNDHWFVIVKDNPELLGSKTFLHMTSPNKGRCGNVRGNILEYNIFDRSLNYLMFLQYNGKHITRLRFALRLPDKKNAPFQQRLINPRFFEEQNLNSLHSKCLDNIFKYCINLTQLQLTSWILKNDCSNSENVSINRSIQHLSIMYTDMMDFALSTLLQRLPSLKHLKLAVCRWGNDEENIREGSSRQNWSISMPFSTLDSVCVSQDCSLENIYLRVDTSMNESKYFNIIIDYENQRFFTTQLDQNNYILQTGYDDDILKITIQCQSLGRVQLRLYGKKACGVPIVVPLTL